MKKLILTSAVGAFALLVSACGDADDADTAEVDATATTAADTSADTAGTTTASADWPAGTRIVEEGGTTYRIAPDGTRTVIADGEWRIVTEGGERFRVNSEGRRVRIDTSGIDVDLDTNRDGNLDLDVSTDGTDASPED